MWFIAVALWVAFLAGAGFYAQEARHSDSKPLAAYLIFVTIFSVAAFTLFGGLTALVQALGQAALLEQPLWAAALLATVFLPAFFLARWQIKKPPRSPHYPQPFSSD